jgi:hypothetical protein
MVGDPTGTERLFACILITSEEDTRYFMLALHDYKYCDC